MSESFKSIERSLHFLNSKAEDYGKAKSQRVHLEEFRKVKKAQLMRQAKEDGIKTAQERESYAYSHEEYIALLEGLKAAVEQEEALKWRLMAARDNIDYHKHRGIYEMATMKLM